MPSLRRAFSSPSVRVSPYPALPSSRSHRVHPHGHRRSSGSDVSDRKVLADIDWWRVTDGQRERAGEEEDEEEGEVEERDVVGVENPAPVDSADSEAMAIASRNDAIPGLPFTDRGESVPGVEPERPSTPVASQSPLSEGDDPNIFGFSQSHVFEQLASESSFALRPRTPTRRRNRSESSTSSVNSTPDSEILRTPIERASFAGMGFADPGPESPLFHVGLASLNATIPLVPKKYSFLGQQLGGVDLNDDKILPDPLMCHDDLFA